MARVCPLLPLLCSLVLACGSDGDGDDDDMHAGVDAAPADAASADAAAAADAAPALPLAGFGALSGDCDLLDSELTDGAPWVLRSAIAFDMGWTMADLAALSPGGQEVYTDGNAGGSSLLSEVFAYEVLYRCELAALLATETEIHYDTPGTITDLLVEIDGTKIGVSVTRAVAFPFDDPYTVQQAEALLTDKLAGVLESSANVAEVDRWQKQVLAVIAYAPGHADALEQALASLDASLRADTIVWIVVSDGDDAFLY